MAYLLGDVAEEDDHQIGRAGELSPQIEVLSGYPDRAGVEMALANHLAAQGEEGEGAEPESLRSQ